MFNVEDSVLLSNQLPVSDKHINHINILVICIVNLSAVHWTGGYCNRKSLNLDNIHSLCLPESGKGEYSIFLCLKAQMKTLNKEW